MTDQTTKLNEKKRCANCGFLYGTTKDSINPSEIRFDPDLLRPPHANARDDIISTCKFSASPKSTGVTPPSQSYTWNNTRSINCLWRMPDAPGKEYTDAKEMKDEVLTEIGKDRSNCPHFFLYHPGFSAKEHIELRIETVRDKQYEKWNNILHDAETFWRKEQSRRSVISLVCAFFFGFTTLILTLVEVLGDDIDRIITAIRNVPGK